MKKWGSIGETESIKRLTYVRHASFLLTYMLLFCSKFFGHAVFLLEFEALQSDRWKMNKIETFFHIG